MQYLLAEEVFQGVIEVKAALSVWLFAMGQHPAKTPQDNDLNEFLGMLERKLEAAIDAAKIESVAGNNQRSKP